MLRNFEGKAFDVWFCSFVRYWPNLLIPSTSHTIYLNATLGSHHPVLVSARMTLAQKLGTYHLFMGNASETEIMALFACLSSLWKMWLKYWWKKWQLFQPLFSSQFAVFFSLPLSNLASLRFPPQHSWLICLQHNRVQHRLISARALFVILLPHSILPAFSCLPFIFFLFLFFPFLSLEAHPSFLPLLSD